MRLQKNNYTLKKQFINLVRWPAGCLIFFITACKENNGYSSFKTSRQDSLQQLAIIKTAFVKIQQLKSQISTGDLVTRTGNDFTILGNMLPGTPAPVNIFVGGVGLSAE